MVQGGERLEHHPQEARKLNTAATQPTPRGQLLGIDHVQLAMPAGAESERAAERFYGEVLGLPRVPKPYKVRYPIRWADRPEAQAQAQVEARAQGQSQEQVADAADKPDGCWFQGPCASIHLGVEEPFRPARKAHPALLVDDIDVIAKRILDTGGELTWTDDDTGRRRAHTFDPFGNRIELVQVDIEPTAEMFQVLVNMSIYPVIMLDQSGTIRWIGASIERFFGYDPAKLIGQHFAHVIAPGSLKAAYEAFASVHEAYEIDPWGGVGIQIDLLHADGYEVSCELAAMTTRRTGLPWYVVFVRQAGYDQALDQAVEAMASGADLGEVLTLVVDAVGHMVPRTGVAVCDRWDLDHFEVTAGNATTLLEPGSAESPWSRALASGEELFVEDRHGLPGPLAALARAEGYEACWVFPVSLSTAEDPTAAIIVWRRYAGGPTRFNRNTLHKATQLLRLTLQWDRSQRSLEFAASHDPLTGLVNRQAFQERLEAVTEGGSGEAAVLYLDLDQFKPVNDQLGHLVGDFGLKTVAERLVNALRPGDLVARMGGDEFAVLCERLGEPAVAERVAERLLDAVCVPITTPEGAEFRLGVSIGVADIQPGEMVDTVLARADEAMRHAKATGRGRWVRSP